MRYKNYALGIIMVSVVVSGMALAILPKVSAKQVPSQQIKVLFEQSKRLPATTKPDAVSTRVQISHKTKTQIIVFSKKLSVAERETLAREFEFTIDSCNEKANRCIVTPRSQTKLALLASNHSVSMISNNDTFKLAAQTLDWGITKLNAKAAWNYPAPTTGANVVVALIDTGVHATHPDLAASINPGGYDYVNGDSDPADDMGHGTAMAGFIAGVNNSEGIAGVAYGAKILPFKACDANGNCYTDAIVDSINAAIAADVDIINMSFGGPANSLMQSAIDAATAAGIIVVAAAGNENAAACLYPAAYSNVICVGAIDESDARGSFSNYGTGLDVVTPGVNNTSTAITLPQLASTYATVSGTSGAAAYYSGSAAVMLSAVKSYCVALPNDPVCSDVRMFTQQVLNNITVRDIGTPGYDSQFGNGAIDLSQMFSLTSVAYTSPAAVIKKGVTTTHALTFTNNHAETVSLQSCTILSDNNMRPQTVPAFVVTTLTQGVTPYASPTNNVVYTTFNFGTPISITAGQTINFSYAFSAAAATVPNDSITYSFTCLYDLSSTSGEVESFKSTYNANVLKLDWPDSLKNLYITFGRLRYNQVVYPSAVRLWDTMYIKNMDPSKVRFEYMFLYDYTKAGNQGYERYRKSATSYGVRTSYLLPRGRRYAYVAVFTDIATGVQKKSYFVFYTK
jgi:subtilisin